MTTDWGKLPGLDQLRMTDGSANPLPGTIVLCLMCAKPFLMRRYDGFPDQVCPECYTTYRDCASLLCSKCGVVIAKVKPAVLENGYYVRPRSVLHSDHCNICRPPSRNLEEGGFDISYVLEIRKYLETVGGGIKKVIITGGWDNA